MTSCEWPFLPESSGIGLDTEWKCPEKDCPRPPKFGKADVPLGRGVCDLHPNRALVRNRPHG
jgi:hypothetical protein